MTNTDINNDYYFHHGYKLIDYAKKFRKAYESISEEFKDPSKLLFISVPYEELDTDTNYRWILNTPMDELLRSNISIVENIKQQI